MSNIEDWRLKGQRYNLIGSIDKDTEKISFPPRHVAVRELPVFNFDKEAESATRSYNVLAMMAAALTTLFK